MTEKIYFSGSGYLCYKMINSQNLLSEMQVQNFILFNKKLCSVLDFLKDIDFFVFLTFLWFSKSGIMMNVGNISMGSKRRSSDSPSGYFISKITSQKHKILDQKSSLIIFGC